MSITLDPATLPEEPLPHDHPLFLEPLTAPGWVTEQERHKFDSAVQGLTDKQTRFLQAYSAMSPRNARIAAIAAGYSPKTAANAGPGVLKLAHVAPVWAILSGAVLPAPILGEARPPCTREEVAAFLSEVIRVTPEEQVRCLADLAAGRSTPSTTSRAYQALERKRITNAKGVTRIQDTLKTVDKLQAAKLLADLNGWRVDKGQIDGTQAAFEEILSRLTDESVKPPPLKTD